MQAARRVDQDRIAALGLRRRNGVEHHGGRIGALARAHHVDAGARRPDLQLLDRGGAEGVGGADQRRAAFALQQVGQLADRRRLAGAVDADNQRHLRMRRDRDRRVHGGEHAPDFLFDQIAQAGAVARPRLDRGDDAIGRRDADVGRDQQLFERVDGFDVDRPRALLGRIRAADDLVEALDDLLRGAGEALTDAREEAHGGEANRVIG